MSSFYSNTVHVDFESVLAMDDPGMVSMFQALIASGLQGFLGCSAMIHEEALLEFFANGTVRDGLVVSTVHRVTVEISEQLFAETFELPVEGLTDLTDVSKDKIFDAKSIVSLTGEPVRTSGTKSQMKIHFRLLCDTMAKSISVKAGSFNAITVEKFAMVTAVVCEVKSQEVSVRSQRWIISCRPEILDKLYSFHLFVLEELKTETLVQDLEWKLPCCSIIFEGRNHDRGAIIARSNTNTLSSCWVRTMMRVNGTWVIEPCADQWVKIPQPIISSEVPSQRQYDDTLPPVSDLFKTFKKRLVDVHLELAQLFITRKLLPVGARNFCRDIIVVEPASRLLRPTITSRVWFQQCTVFTQFPLFHRINSVDVSDFVSSIALERTALRRVQRSFASSVAPHVQLLDEKSSSSSSSDESMNFDDSTSISLPASPSPDITEALNQLRASIDEIREQDDGAKNKDTILLHLQDFEKQVIARLDAQDRVLGALHRDSNDQRNLLSLELQSSHKQLGTQIVTTGLDVVDVRRVFSAQAQQTLNIITSQLSELVAYINRGGDNKNGESSSSRPLPPPADQIRDSGNAGGRTPDFEQRVEMAKRNIMERAMDADRRESLVQAERDRERRRRELSGSKRRRRH
ncbi:hypothetical protein F511_30613 [Dorcoceras hygrometricum]|uniref:Dystroglycan-like n=1 Tax=Dorcoceras hygrometricum TaxID=472368 RepID=A0A2Z7BBY4_9LAMI|nr:hypothetical protein F511_30613 [Dorcoceras hygrometricum]